MDSTFRLVPLTAIVATLLSLSACQTIPKAKTEPVVAQTHIAINQPYETYDSQTVSGTNQPSIASQRWQDFYSDAKLKQLIQLGLDNNKDINAAVLAIQKSRAQYQITDINDLPTFNGSASAARTACSCRFGARWRSCPVPGPRPGRSSPARRASAGGCGPPPPPRGGHGRRHSP